MTLEEKLYRYLRKQKIEQRKAGDMTDDIMQAITEAGYTKRHQILDGIKEK